MKNIDYGKLPEHMRQAMQYYIEHRILPGGFLTAVLENNLRDAVARADHINKNLLAEYVEFLYNDAPSTCWGSPEKVNAWISNRGIDE